MTTHGLGWPSGGFRAAFVIALLVLTGCELPGSDADVFDASLPADDRRVPGPSYLQIPVWQEGKPDPSVMHTPSGPREIDEVSYAWWTRDGDLVAAARSGLRRYGADGDDARVRAPGLNPDQAGATPEAISALSDRDALRIDVYSPDLAEHRTIGVPADALETDQESSVPGEAELTLHGDPLTLDGVTWVEWGVNSEDDTKTDHGILRIDGDEVDGVLRNEPIVRLYPANDGSALMLLRQDNGESEDCGGCVVEQDLVELDPTTGEVAAEYGMPPDYTRQWRVDAVDKVGETVAARFRVYPGEAEDGQTAAAEWQLWTYDGEWSEQEDLAGVRVWHQDGGRLVETPLDPERAGQTAAGEVPSTLTWVPGETGSIEDGEMLFEPSRETCELGGAEEFCPMLVTTGSLLPRG